MSTPAAGWYVDSIDPSLVRWWDGSAWSDHTQPNPQPPAAAPVETAAAAPVAAVPAPAASVPLVPSAPYVPPPFADPAPAAPEPSAAAALDYPPPAFRSPDFAAPAAAPPPSGAPAASNPAPRRAGSSLPISEPVRLTPPASGAIPVAGFPGFDEPPPSAAPSSGPAPLAVPSPLPADASVPGSFAATPLATATPLPASASTPWTSSSSFAQPTSAVDLASVDYEPMTRSWGSARATSAPRVVTGVTTGGAWMLAISPLLQLGLAALGWWLTEGGTSSTTTIVASGLGAVALIWILLAAILDYRRLGALGHEFRPSVLWIIAGPFFYLMARAIHVYRTTRTGTGPTWVYVVTALIVGAAFSVSSLALPREASLSELRAVETQIASELRAQGVDYSVICPSQVPASLGSSFVCTAYDEVGPAALLRVTWSGVPGAFTYEIESTAA